MQAPPRRRHVARCLLQAAALLAVLPTAAGFFCAPCVDICSRPLQVPRSLYPRQPGRAARPPRPGRRRAAEACSRHAAAAGDGADAGRDEADPAVCGRRRDAIVAAAGMLAALSLPAASSGAAPVQGAKRGRRTVPETLVQVSDPGSYSALAYAPPGVKGKLPLIVVLHGAGKNELDAWSLADPKGEHAGLAPSLLATGRAPPELADNFALVAPYSAGKRSFYEEPRKRVLQFVDWVCSEQGRAAGCPLVDPDQVFLFGFSDGATVGIELMTSGRFKGGVFAAYGFTGQLPELALKRLKDVPIWIFHSADDVIFDVRGRVTEFVLCHA